MEELKKPVQSSGVSDKRGFRIRPIYILGATILTVIFAWILFLVLMGLRVNNRLTGLRERGYPMTSNEFRQWRESTPEAEQNALDLIDVLQRMPDQHEIHAARRFSELLEQRHPEAMELARDHLLACQDELMELRKVLEERSDFRFPIDAYGGILAGGSQDWTSDFYRGNRNVNLAVRYHAFEGRYDEALEFLEDALRMSDSIQRETSKVYSAKYSPIHDLVRFTLEAALLHPDMSDSHLARLDELLARAEERSGSREELMIPYFCYTIESFFERDRERPLKHRLTGIWHLKVLYEVDMFEEIIDVRQADITPRERVKLLREMYRRDDEPPRYIKEKISYAFEYLWELSHIARIRNTRAAVAVERFRRANGRLPDSLADLVPQYLAAVPGDPFTGEPLKYRHMEKGEVISLRILGFELRNGYLVYSAGEDMEDNGGNFLDILNNYAPDGYDIVFAAGDVEWLR